MSTKLIRFAILVLGLGFVSAVCGTEVQAQVAAPAYDRYRAPEEARDALVALNGANPAITALHKIGTSAGGRDLLILEIGPETAAKGRALPAVLVVANPEGIVPIAGEAALYLAEQIIGRAAPARDLTWFILATANPDAAARFFSRPLLADERNVRGHNDDHDDQEDEDGPDDLDGNGLITQMRVRDPAGEWIPVPGEARLLRRADPAKGEKGIFRLYSEGTDNDGDGEYNEDPPGGINIGITFPHLFHPFTSTGGGWPGSEEETFSIIKFVFAHPEIAMTITFGATNMCLQPPAGGRQGAADLTQIKIPERYASRFGVDPNRTYTIQEVMALIRPMVPPGIEVTEAMVASFLGLGAVVNPLEEDLKVYRELSERYKEFLKAAKLDAKRIEPPQPKDGSFELWSYYHLGVHTYSMDFWTLPEVKEEEKKISAISAETLEAMSPDAFLELGEAKIADFLKEVGAPPSIKAAMLIEGVKAGKMTPKQMAGMLRKMPKPGDTSGADPKHKALLAFSDKELQGKGFLPWTAFKLPALGEVEIGGPAPFADTTPPTAMIRPLLEGQVPWVFRLAEKLPRARILKTDAAARGGGVHELTVWVENSGALPFPTAMGRRNRQVPPLVVSLGGSGYKILSGKKRNPIEAIDAGKSVKVVWLLQAEKAASVDIRVESANAWNASAQVQLGGAQ